MNKDGKKTILLVEDEALIAMSETRVLEKNDYEVVTAHSGETAIELVDSNPQIDLILMDIDLGTGIDGTEAAERILTRHDLPLAFLSSHTEPEVVEKTEGITSYGYIVKNSGETVLLASVRMAFRLYDAHVELKRQKEDLNNALRKYEQTAEELADKNEELDRYFSSSLDLLCIADASGEFIRLNPEWENVLGYSVTEMVGRLIHDFVHPDDRETTMNAITTLNTGENRMSFENRLRSKHGEYRWIEWRSRSIGSEIYAAARDITERKRAEYETKEREENLRITLNSIGDGVISTDSEGAVLRMNPAAERLCGWRIDEAHGQPLTTVFHIVHADTGKTVENPVADVLETGNVIGLANHTTLISRDGTEFQIADSAAPIRDDHGRITGVVLVFRDVTEEYRIAQALAENEHDMAQAQALVRLGSWRFNLDTGTVTASDQARRIYGVEDGELTIDYVQSFPLPEYRPRLDAALKALVDDDTPYDIEFQIRRPSDNTIRSIHSIATYDAQHRQVIGTLQDVTERRLAEETLRLKSRFIDRIAEVSPDLFIIFDNDGTYLEIIAGNEDYLFLHKEELIGRKTSEVIPEPAASIIMDGIRDALSSNSLKVVEYELEIQTEKLYFEARLVPLNRDRVLAQIIDITERKRAKERQQEALTEKEFLMKELNHRVKNGLAMVSSLIRLKDAETEIDLSDLQHQIEAIGLIHEKLYQTESVTEICLRDYIADLLSSIFSSFSTRDVTIESDIADHCVSTKTALSLGLIVNEIATNAMKHGFTDTGDAVFSIRLQKDEEDGRYVLTVSNTGKPFPDEISIDNADTLGLRLMSALVDQIDGSLVLQKRPYPVFIIQFPVAT